MELLATIGLASKELFDYNRESYMFDNEQRLERELLRLDMQVSRFELFREDIRDLADLTVGKMKMYLLVAALFLDSAFKLYMEGRIKQQLPPYLMAAYYLSVTGAFAFLLISISLGIFASVCAHSFAVRLLTRYVRLPIPGEHMLEGLNAHLGDFERQGARAVRVPFVMKGDGWQERQYLETVREGRDDGNSKLAPVHQAEEDVLGKGELPFQAAPLLMKATPLLPGKHVQLYRQLQNKWQCYDAYARVCMSLGTNQMLLALTFYLVAVTLICFRSASACYASVIMFQSIAMYLCFIDIRQMLHRTIFAIQSLPIAATLLATLEAHVSDKIPGTGVPASDTKFPAAPAIFFLIAAWFELMLRISWPSNDGYSLPRRFRAVLFLDVFASMELNVHSMEGQVHVPLLFGRRQPAAGGGASPQLAEKRLKQATQTDDALALAHAALRRWESIPAGLSERRRGELVQMRRELDLWRQAMADEMEKRAVRKGISAADAAALVQVDDRPWNDLTEEEQLADPFAGRLVGPVEDGSATGGRPAYYFDPDDHTFLYDLPNNAPSLSFEDTRAAVAQAERRVERLLQRLAPPPPEHTAAFLGAPSFASAGVVPETVIGRSAEESVERVRSFDSIGSAASLRTGFALRSSAAVRPLAARYQPRKKVHPSRGPWKLFIFVVRSIQVAWLFAGFTFLMQSTTDWDFDCTSYRSWNGLVRWLRGGDCRTRYLGFKGLQVTHPAGRFFRPQSLACLPSVPGADSTLLVSTVHQEAFLATVAEGRDGLGSVTFETLPGLGVSTDETASVMAFCPSELPRDFVGGQAALAQRCLLGMLSRGGSAIKLWRLSQSVKEAVELPIEIEAALRLVVGTLVPCDKVEEMTDVYGDFAIAPDATCLVLAAWDGKNAPVAALPVPEDLQELVHLGEVVPIFDVPLGAFTPAEGALGVPALAVHYESNRLRLWTTLKSEAFQVVDIWPPRFDRIPPINSQVWQRMWWPKPGSMEEEVKMLCRTSDDLYLIGEAGGGELLWMRAVSEPSPG